MKTGLSPKRLLRYAGIALVFAVILYIGWRGWVTGSSIFAGILLVLFAAAILSFKLREIRADREIARRINTEFPHESQPEALDLYHGLKTKELEYLFAKVLDDAKGDMREVRRLAAIAQSVGSKAFLENRW